MNKKDRFKQASMRAGLLLVIRDLCRIHNDNDPVRTLKIVFEETKK